MNIKAIITDLDGTVMAPKIDALPNDKVKYIFAEMGNEFKISAATGRSVPRAKQLFELLSIKNPCVVSAGTKIYDPVNKIILWQRNLEPDQVNEIRKVIIKNDLTILINDDLIPDKENRKNFNQNINVIYIMNVPEALAPKINMEINRIKNISAHNVKAWTDNNIDIHITHNEATKEHAIQKLLEIINVRKEESAGIGDSDNDLPLFDAVGLKIAMGNGTEKLKKKADVIAPDYYNDGVVWAMNLIKSEYKNA